MACRPGSRGYGATQFHTGVIRPDTFAVSNYNPSFKYVNSVTNLRSTYYNDETARLRLYSRPRNWSPNIYSVATNEAENTIIESASYQVHRVSDGKVVIEYGTASIDTPSRGEGLHTQLSFDVSGNYFDLDMGLLEPGYAYGMRLAYYNGSIGSWVVQPETFKFRVEK